MAKKSEKAKKAYKPPDYSKKYDVFISYRRDGGEAFAAILYERLTKKGYRVFQDIEALQSGDFNRQLLEVIERCTDVIVVCSKGALDRCVNEDDWVRQEVAHALSKGKNVVPILLRNFHWPAALPEDLAGLPDKAGIEATSNEHFPSAIERLCKRFLKSRAKKHLRKGAKVRIGCSTVAALLLVIAIIAVAANWNKIMNPSSPQTVNAIEDFYFLEGTNSVSYEGADSVVHFPPSLNGAPVKNIVLTSNNSISELHIPKSAEQIHINGCENLKRMYFADGIGEMGGQIVWCKNLTYVEISSRMILKDPGELFLDSGKQLVLNDKGGKLVADAGVVYSSDRKTIYHFPIDVTGGFLMPNTVTKIERQAFAYSELSTITLSLNLTTVREHAFWNARKVESLSFPEGTQTIEHQAFLDCINLKSISFPETLEATGTNLFSGCSKYLTIDDKSGTFTSRDGVVYQYTKNYYGAYSGIDKILTLVHFPYYWYSGMTAPQPEEVTFAVPDGVVSIGYKAFEKCDGLRELILPESLLDIGEAFGAGNALKIIRIPASVISISDKAFSERLKDQITIYTPKDSVADKYARKNGIAVINI